MDIVSEKSRIQHGLHGIHHAFFQLDILPLTRRCPFRQDFNTRTGIPAGWLIVWWQNLLWVSFWDLAPELREVFAYDIDDELGSYQPSNHKDPFV